MNVEIALHCVIPDFCVIQKYLLTYLVLFVPSVPL